MNYAIVCYTHDDPLIKIDFKDSLVIWFENIGKIDCKQHLSVKEKYDDLDYYRPQLLGAAGSIAARRFFQENPPSNPENLIIIQTSYRKFVANVKIGKPSVKIPGLMLIDEFMNIDSSKLMPKKDGFLLPAPLNINSTSINYAICHKIPDLLRYTAIAVELGVLNELECIEFLNCPLLIPCGAELGVLPYLIWDQIISDLERVNLETCSKHNPVLLDRYQRRAVAFCAERLGSFLLLKKLNSIYGRYLPKEIFGYMTAVINSNESDYTHNIH